jgi:MarR family transcriptional regulator, transcriptional regulator for hemolysin
LIISVNRNLGAENHPSAALRSVCDPGLRTARVPFILASRQLWKRIFPLRAAKQKRRAELQSAMNPLESLPYLLDRSIAHWNARLAKRLASIQLTFEQWRVLLVTAQEGPMSIKELSQRTLVPHSTLGRWLARMEQDGLISRRIRESDNRAVEASITNKGLRSFTAALPIAVDEYESTVEGFSKQELAVLTNLLRRLLDRIDRNHPGNARK